MYRPKVVKPRNSAWTLPDAYCRRRCRVSNRQESIFRPRRGSSVLPNKSHRGYVTPPNVQFGIWPIQVYAYALWHIVCLRSVGAHDNRNVRWYSRRRSSTRWHPDRRKRRRRARCSAKKSSGQSSRERLRPELWKMSHRRGHVSRSHILRRGSKSRPGESERNPRLSNARKRGRCHPLVRYGDIRR